MTQAAKAPPLERELLLQEVEEAKTRIYRLVRTILDDLEAVAPWERLYYPPTETNEFLSMETALVGMIEDIPQRIAGLLRDLEQEALDDSVHEVIDNLDFYFQGIQISVAAELAKLKDKLEAFKSRGTGLTAEERNFTCEISADLKGKYTSSIMGAAASLVAEGKWNGIEIEPILFPEKAEEFDRNELLVETLSEVTEDIGNFLELVPLMEVVASWQEQRRIDQYALSPFYTLLGNLGKLMQFSSRRALYSGDYHQIQRRETLLSVRINELMTLHGRTWGEGLEETQADDSELFPLMILKATELAAILDVDILKKVIGESAVKDLFFIVTMEKEDAAAGRDVDTDRKLARRSRVPQHLHGLIPLLYDEDLKTFLELLLGSVLKRASLTVKRETVEPAVMDPSTLDPSVLDPSTDATAEALSAAAAPASGDSETPTEVLPPIDLTVGELPTELAGFDPLAEPLQPVFDVPALQAEEDTGAEAGQAARREALEHLLEALQPLLSRSGAHRKSFELVRRLLKQKRTIPTGLLDSMRPFLYDVMNQLIPRLQGDTELNDMAADYGAELFDICQILCDPSLTPETFGFDLPASMEKVLDLLNRLAIATRSSLERLPKAEVGEPAI